MASESLHIVLFPWLAFGHLNPFFELAKCLTNKGHCISFVSTPRNISRLPKIHSNVASLFTFVELQLPSVQHLPDGAEATSDLPLNKIPYLKKAYDGLQLPMTDFLEASSPDWLICDFASHWLPSTAAKLDIPCAFFSIFNAANICFMGPPSSLMGVTEDTRTKPEEYTVQPRWIPFPSNMAFRTFEINRLYGEALEENESGVSDGFRLGASTEGCQVLLFRTCTSFESEWLNLVRDTVYRKPVLPTGLLPPELDATVDYGQDQNWVRIKEWLDKQAQRSVVYVAFGSEATLSQQEMTELALGLELSKLPFFWVLRSPPGFVEPVTLPTGFEDRVKGWGIIWRGWVPQLKILSHSAMGGSLMHSGWSSIIETLGVGLPLVLLPMVNDQPLLARLLVWKKIGVEIRRNDQHGWFTGQIVADTLKMVMVDKDGEQYRTMARDLRSTFADKIEQSRYIDDIISYFTEHRRVNV